MLLYLVRHGEARPGSLTTSDASRKLSPRGRRQCQWIGEQIASADGPQTHTLILASGLVRATQTAKIIHEIIAGELRCERSLELSGAVDDVLSAVSDEMLAGCTGPIMLVGHNPQMEALVTTIAQGHVVQMRPGTAVLIELEGSKTLERGEGVIRNTLRLHDE